MVSVLHARQPLYPLTHPVLTFSSRAEAQQQAQEAARRQHEEAAIAAINAHNAAVMYVMLGACDLFCPWDFPLTLSLSLPLFAPVSAC